MSSYRITVSHAEKNITWSHSLTKEEYLQVKSGSRAALGIIPAVCIPVRVHNWRDFSKDFFLPTTVNRAIKVQHIAGKAFAMLIALFVDVATLPIRFVTCIPRAIYNPTKEENPLYQYLLPQHTVSEELLESDYVKVRLEERQSSKTIWQERYVNFIEVPEYAGAYATHTGFSLQ